MLRGVLKRRLTDCDTDLQWCITVFVGVQRSADEAMMDAQRAWERRLRDCEEGWRDKLQQTETSWGECAHATVIKNHSALCLPRRT